VNASRVARLAAGACALLLLAGTTTAAPDSGHSRPHGGFVSVITIDGEINPAAADYLDQSLTEADRDGAAAFVIELDTPGGMLESARRMVKSILGAPLPTIVYVAPSGAAAASAGTFIVEAANIAAMAPATTIGAAHPVESGGQNIEGVMGQKIENFTASWARSIAHQRGRNEDWVDDAVRHSVSITEREALQKHVIDIVAPNLAGVFAQASGRKVDVDGREVTLDLSGAAVERMEMTLGQRVLNALSDPNLLYLLLLGGLIGLYFEFAHPGVYLPGVAGAILLLLAFASFEVLPVNLVGLLLILLGVALLIAEAWVSTYGVFALGGVAAFIFGSLFLIDTSRTNLVVDRRIIYGAAAGVAVVVLGVGYFVARTRRSSPRVGSEALVGEVGQVREMVAPGSPGKVFVHGEIWRASSEDTLAPGAAARVIAVRGLEIHVGKAQ